MSILVPPDVFRVPSTFQWIPVANTRSSPASPFNGSMQTLTMPGQRWAAKLGWSGLTQEEWRRLAAFVAKLGGQAGRFYWGPPVSRLGTDAANIIGSDEPRVRTAGQSGSVLDVTGFHGAGMPFKAGDFLSWQNPAYRPELHVVTDDVAAVEPSSTNIQVYSGDFYRSGVFVASNMADGGAQLIPDQTTYYARRVTPTSTPNYLGNAGAVAVTPGAFYTFSVSARLASGTNTAGHLLGVSQYTAGGSYIRTDLGPSTTGVNSLWYQQYRNTQQMNAAAAFVQITWVENLVGGVFDLYYPQIEPYPWGTTQIITAAAPVTRTQSVQVPIWPPIRVAPNADQPLQFNALAPIGVFKLLADRNPFDVTRGLIGAVSLDIEEALV